MKTDIISTRLLNRIFIKENVKLTEIIDMIVKNDMSVKIGTDGYNNSGPFIENIYIMPNKLVDIGKFKDSIVNLSQKVDAYIGIKPYTLFEFFIKYQMYDDQTRKEGKVYFVGYIDPVDKTIHIESLSKKDNFIKECHPKNQRRITYQEILTETNQELFRRTPSVEE